MANVIKHKRGSGSDPAANNLVIGELAIRTDTGKLFTKMDSGAIAEIAGGGSDIAINTLSSSSATGGGSATFNGSAYRFTLSAPPSVSAAQLLVSINGVIQKPVAGTGQPSEGFSVDGTDIILGDAPATGSDFFILTFKSLGVSEPADNSVTSAKIVDGTIVNADINASASITGTKISPNFGSQNIVSTGYVSVKDLYLTDDSPTVFFTDSNNTDYIIEVNSGIWKVRDTTNSADRLVINSDGHIDIAGNLDVGAGVDVTGNITATGNVGIGTTSPVAPFHVAHSGTSTAVGTNFISLRSGASGRDIGIQFADGATSAYVGMLGGAIYFADSGSSEKMRIDSSGRVLIGTSSSRNVGGSTTNSKFQIEGTSTNTSSMSLVNNENSTAAPFVFFGKTRGNSAGESGIVQDGDTLGGLSFIGADSVDTNNRTAEITAVVNGSPANNTIPTDLVFSTSAQNATQLAERMRIDSSGDVVIGSSTNGGSNRLYVVDSHTDAYVNPTDSILRIENENTSGTTGQASISFTSKTSGSNADSAIVSQAEDASGNSRLEFWTDVANGMTEKMVITSSGKVGIGTTTVGNKLQVHEASSNASFAGFSNDTTGSSSSDGLIVGLDSDENGVLYHYENKAIRFATNNSERMRIDSSGRVMIGTTTEGEVNADDLTIASSGNTGITIRSGTSNFGSIYFSDGTSGNAEYRGLIAYNQPNNYLQFFTAATERMRIDSSGRLIVGGTSSEAFQAITLSPNHDDGAGRITFNRANTSNVSIVVSMKNASSEAGRIEHDNTSCGIFSSSDYRLKENVTAISDGITRLKTLKPYRFNFKTDTSKTVDGFFAHEVTAVPEAISGTKDGVDSDNNPVYQAIDQSKLVPLLVAALQEAIGRIEALEAK